MVGNPATSLPFPGICGAIRLPGGTDRDVYRGMLGAWWEYVVPEHRRTRHLDRSMARVLSSARNPVRLLQWLQASGGYSVRDARRFADNPPVILCVPSADPPENP